MLVRCTKPFFLVLHSNPGHNISVLTTVVSSQLLKKYTCNANVQGEKHIPNWTRVDGLVSHMTSLNQTHHVNVDLCRRVHREDILYKFRVTAQSNPQNHRKTVLCKTQQETMTTTTPESVRSREHNKYATTQMNSPYVIPKSQATLFRVFFRFTTREVCSIGKYKILVSSPFLNEVSKI